MRRLTTIFFLLFVGMAAIPIEAADSPASNTFRSEHVQVRLISAVTAVGDQKQAPLGLHVKLQNDWKIYWRSPGDAGFPPRLTWDGSENLKDAEISWPAPKRFSVLGFDTQGYKDEVVLPIQAALAEPGKPLHARAKLDFLACREICIPYNATLALSLPAGPAGISRDAHLINRFKVLVPGVGTSHGLKIDRAVFTDDVKKPVLSVTASSGSVPFTNPDIFVEGGKEIQFGKPRIELADEKNSARFQIPIFGLKDLKGGTDTFLKHPLVFTLVDGKRSIETRLAPTTRSAAQESAPSVSSALWQIVLIALLGGLILNLMPCVLPVLSIKLLGVVSHGGRESRAVRFSFVASAAGIVFSFLVLAGSLIALKAAGMSIGWGIQFQQPWFLIAMAVIVTLFACNLWGFFEIALPRWIADAGEHTSHVHGLGGHFVTGILATLLATPCSAPFLGTAVGFALSRGTSEILIIFAALGVGLALPYLLIAAAPKLATSLPRPGRWMLVLRKILGFALAATAIWLLSVLIALIDLTATSLIAAVLLAVIVLLYARHHRTRLPARKVWPAVGALIIAAFFIPAWLADSTGQANKGGKRDSYWTPFDEAAIPRLVGQGKTVFVDVTADWCITCQVNKALVLDAASIRKQLGDKRIVAMQADWTRPDEAIARYLAKFGRYGIPFNAVYGPNAPAGIALPELLTQAAVQQALDRAKTHATADRGRK
ncbi:MAG: protein-disulfide reductase DsbD family protein [Rhodospirillales bacterium]